MRYLRKEKKSNQPNWGYAVPFFAVLGILTVVSFLIPLRPEVSYSEKRELAKFPEFSFTALADGSYFDDISLWFSDTFPGRETWITLANYDDSLHGYSQISISGELPVTETVPPILDNQEPALPAAPMETQGEQTQTAETEPEETEWGGVDAGDAAEIIRNATAFQIGDSAFIFQNFSQATSDSYAATLNQLASEVEPYGVTVISAPAPTAVGVMIEDAYQEKLGSVSQVSILEYIASKLDDRVVAVDTASALIAHNSEYLFFRTDHHWTALGAYYSYQAICSAIGLEAVDINSLETWDQGEFKGSLYGRVNQPSRLRPDTVIAYIPEGDIEFEVYYSLASPKSMPLLSDASNRTVHEKYLVFGTDYPMTHAENKSLPDAPNVIVVKDSFGNCFVPFLTQSFHNVYALDYRKFRESSVAQMVEEYDIDYVIVMPYITAIQDSQGPGMFQKVCLGRWS